MESKKLFYIHICKKKKYGKGASEILEFQQILTHRQNVVKLSNATTLWKSF
jgi:hypothetical protein